MGYNMFLPPSSKLDAKAIFIVPLQLFAGWLGIVMLGTWIGYSNIVCLTPLAWIIAIRVGHQIVVRSKSALPTNKMTEAGLAGALLGLLQGILFAIVLSMMDTGQSSASTPPTGMILLASFASVWIGAGLSFFTAYLKIQKLIRG